MVVARKKRARRKRAAEARWEQASLPLPPTRPGKPTPRSRSPQHHSQWEWYFAFGSNMSLTQMSARCPGARPGDAATLPEHRLAFVSWSPRWDGGVATVEPSTGERCWGRLFLVSQQHLQALDGYEGAPWVYQRERVSVQRRDGSMVSAWAYIHTEASSYCPPSSSYLDTIEEGYEAAEVSALDLYRAAERSVDGETWWRVFVYGTLRAGQPNHRLLEEGGAQWEGEDAVEGLGMWSLGGFPACAPLEGGRVVGEVYVVDNATLARLDRLEGTPRFYQRVVVNTVAGRATFVYTMTENSLARAPRVATGDWVRHGLTHDYTDLPF